MISMDGKSHSLVVSGNNDCKVGEIILSSQFYNNDNVHVGDTVILKYITTSKLLKLKVVDISKDCARSYINIADYITTGGDTPVDVFQLILKIEELIL